MALDRDQVQERLAAGNGGARDLSGLDLSGADLSRLDLRGVDLSRADLSAADLRWAVLEGADLRSTILRRADMRWAVLRGTNLRQADLGRANLGWADVTGADLSGSDMDGANLESVDLSVSIMDRPAHFGGGPARPRARAAADGPPRPVGGGAAAVAMPRPMPGWAPAGWALPDVTPAAVAAAVLGVAALLHGLGWLFRRSYFVDGFRLDEAGIVAIGQWANLQSGVTDVAWLTVKALVAAPLVLVAAAIVLGLVLLPVGLLWRFGERVLGDVVRPGMRPVVVGGLFVAYTAVFVLVILPALAATWRWVSANGLPGDEGLRTVVDLFKTGGLFTRAGILAVLAACGVPLWTAWRWWCGWLVAYQPPLEWRLRYPALNAAVAGARTAPLFRHNGPLTADEMRRLRVVGSALVLVLALLLTGAGRVRALHDMCDGGDLQRLQLFFGEPPANVQGATLCQRLVAETDDAYYVFFPSQTREVTPGDLGSREPNLRVIDKGDDIQARLVPGGSDWCPTCGNPNGQEVFIAYPNQAQTEGLVTEQAANLVLLDVEPGQLGTVRLSDTTQVTLDGGPATAADLMPGVTVVAFGAPAADDPNILEAREVNALSAAVAAPGATPLPPASFNVNLLDGRNPVFSGAGWTAGNDLEIRLVKVAPGDTPTKDTPGIPLLYSVTVADDGSFSSPIAYREGMPTGPDYAVLAIDPATGQTVRGDWLATPPPTETPLPTAPPAQPTLEVSATPEGPPTATLSPDDPDGATATAQSGTATAAAGRPTNTPFPTRELPGMAGSGAVDCDPDEFEFDSGRGFQKEMYVGFGDPQPQRHNFCPKGDIDLAFFRVKKGRWYRVSTTSLAAGVDTVMAVGDLNDSTPCEPAGCWSDDRGALTYESQIVFKALEDDVALVTVDNRGTKHGTEATYELSVVEFQPEPTPTLTPVPSGTPTPTRTPTATPLALRDPYEPNDTCAAASLDWLKVRNPAYGQDPRDESLALRATLRTATDEDHFVTQLLEPGSYVLAMRPPDDRDYDLELRSHELSGSRRTCQLLVAERFQDDDEMEEIVFQVGTPAIYVVKVYVRDGSKGGDPHHYYHLWLQNYGPPPTPRPPDTPVPTPTVPTPAPPPPTLTPTAVRPVLP